MPGARRETGSLDRLNGCMHSSSAAADGRAGLGTRLTAVGSTLRRNTQTWIVTLWSYSERWVSQMSRFAKPLVPLSFQSLLIFYNHFLKYII